MSMDAKIVSRLSFEKKGAITCVTFPHDDDAASFDRSLLMELRYALRRIERDQDCKAVVLIGADTPFFTDDENAAGGRLDSDVQAQLHDEVLLLLDGLRPVTIAVRNGGRESEGDDLAPACDLVVAGFARQGGSPAISWAVAPYPSSKQKLAGIADHLPEIEDILNAAFPEADKHTRIAADNSVGAAPKKAVCKRAA